MSATKNVPNSFLMLLMFMVLLSPLGIDIFLPAMPVMAQEFKVSASQIQTTVTFFMFAMGLGQILIGPLADKIGRRPVALAGICLYILSALIGAVSQEFAYLQLARLAQGLAACATSIVVFSAVRDCYSNKENARIYSYLNGAICVVPALAPSFGGLLTLEFGWRSTFIFMLAYALCVLVIVGKQFKETRPESTQSAGRLYQWSKYQPILASPHFLFYAASCMMGMGAILTYVTYSPVWLIDHLGLTSIQFSLLFGFNALINVIACFVAPKVIRKLGNRPTVIFAFGLLLVAGSLEFIGFFFGPSSGLLAGLAFMLPMLLLCIGFAFLLGPATSMALSEFGERAGTAAAMLGCIQMSGASVIAFIIQQTSIPAPVACAIIMAGGACVFLFILKNQSLAHWHHEAKEDS